MTTGVVAEVLRVGSADALPLPPPPGVVVVSSPDAARTARALAVALGTGGPLGSVEARAELQRRREADLREPRERAKRCRADAAAARAETEAARSRLPQGANHLSARAVRRAAGAVAGAVQAVEQARSCLGDRPLVDTEAVRAAHDADAELGQARSERYTRLPRANSVLTLANGAAGMLVVGRLLTDAFDPAFFLVAVLPLSALVFTAGPVVANVRRCRAAARRRWTALRSLDVSTMDGLADLEARAAAWTERRARLVAAESDLARVQRAWRSLVGEHVPVGDAGRLVADLEAVARLDGRCESAQQAWTQAAADLQRAEDMAGSGHPPMVVFDTRRLGGPASRRRAVEGLAAEAGAARVVIVEQESPRARRLAGDAPPDQRAAVIDVRTRLLAGLNRLRMKPGARHRAPPGSVAASG